MRPLHRVPLRRFIPRDWRYPREHPKTLHCYLKSWRPLHAPPPLQRDRLSARFWAIYFYLWASKCPPRESREKVDISADVRVRFAVGIATAVMFTHAAGLVHESICPENILNFLVTDRIERSFSKWVEILIFSLSSTQLIISLQRQLNLLPPRDLMLNSRPYQLVIHFTQDQLETFLVGFDAARLLDYSVHSI